MADVARRAGVSHMTVSRVLNEPWRVRAQTRERVESVISELGYRPNAAARSLVTRRSRTVGVVALETTLVGPSGILHGIEEAARDAGYYVSIATAPAFTVDALRSSVARLMESSVDGVVVIAPFRDATEALDALDAGVPAVLVEGLGFRGSPTVAIDQELGGRLVVDHLLQLGHVTVHHISGPPDWTEAEGRVAGWRSALESAGREVPRLVAGDWSAGSGYLAAREMLAGGGVTAIFAANDHMALGALRAAYEAGLRVPADVSVAGFDDVTEAAYYLPPLTTVRQDFAEIGRQAMQLLAGRLARAPLARDDVVLAPSLVIRASTGPFPA
jgi:DNA-binding LacI/PurR family transcriptional regulator